MNLEESATPDGIRSSRWTCPFCGKELPEIVRSKLLGRGWNATGACPSPGCSTRIKIIRGTNGEKQLLFQRLDLAENTREAPDQENSTS